MSKRILIAILTFILALTLAACGVERVPASTDTPDDTAPVVDTVTSDESERAQTESNETEQMEPAPEVKNSTELEAAPPEDGAAKEVPPVEEEIETEAETSPAPDVVEDKQPTETKDEPTLAHQHSYTASVVPSSCTTNGYTTYTCECGHSYTADYTGGGGHKYEEVYEHLPVYEKVPIMRCGGCHANLDEVGGVAHIKEEALAGTGGSSYSDVDYVIVGYEDQLVGYTCAICGAER